jgi:hypothetical protein
VKCSPFPHRDFSVPNLMFLSMFIFMIMTRLYFPFSSHQNIFYYNDVSFFFLTLLHISKIQILFLFLFIMFIRQKPMLFCSSMTYLYSCPSKHKNLCLLWTNYLQKARSSYSTLLKFLSQLQNLVHSQIPVFISYVLMHMERMKQHPVKLMPRRLHKRQNCINLFYYF